MFLSQQQSSSQLSSSQPQNNAQIDFSWLDALSITELEAQLTQQIGQDLFQRVPTLKTLQEAVAVQTQKHQLLLQEQASKNTIKSSSLARLSEAQKRISTSSEANDAAIREYLEVCESNSIQSISKCLAKHLEKVQALSSALETSFKQQSGALSLQEFCKRFRAARMVARQLEYKLKSLKELQTLGYTQIPDKATR
jgi:hypothetical protein